MSESSFPLSSSEPFKTTRPSIPAQVFSTPQRAAQKYTCMRFSQLQLLQGQFGVADFRGGTTLVAMNFTFSFTGKKKPNNYSGPPVVLHVFKSSVKGKPDVFPTWSPMNVFLLSFWFVCCFVVTGFPSDDSDPPPLRCGARCAGAACPRRFGPAL